MKNIQEFVQKSKGWLEAGIDNWGLILVVLLTGIGSFGLGRLSMLEEVRPIVALESAPSLAQPQALYIGGLVVASRTGTSYYYPWCLSGAQIAPSNELWFKDEAAAQKAGYKPAKNCKGLVLQ